MNILRLFIITPGNLVVLAAKDINIDDGYNEQSLRGYPALEDKPNDQNSISMYRQDIIA